MKTVLTTLLISSSFFGLTQEPTYSSEPKYLGSVKSVITNTYISDQLEKSAESTTLNIQNTLHPTCEVCEHFEKFDKKGNLVEKQEYIIFEPVSDLEMGYCLHLDYEYKNGELILITSKEFEQHGMWDPKVDFENSEAKITYSLEKDGESSTENSFDYFGKSEINQYENGLLMRDAENKYEYNEKGQKVKSTAIKEDVNGKLNIETWTYKNDLLESRTYTSVSSYFFGILNEYAYYDSGKLLSEKQYILSGEAESYEKKLQSIDYYYEDGRDSLYHYVNFYSQPISEDNYIFSYEFHPNGTISTKTRTTEFGDINGFESYDDRGNLTQYNSYNIYFDVYQTDKYTYNEKNQLIEKSVVESYNDEAYNMLYTYDEHGNQTHLYRESDGVITLVEQKFFEYY